MDDLRLYLQVVWGLSRRETWLVRREPCVGTKGKPGVDTWLGMQTGVDIDIYCNTHPRTRTLFLKPIPVPTRFNPQRVWVKISLPDTDNPINTRSVKKSKGK